MAGFEKQKQYLPTQIQELQYVDKYSRFNYRKGRRETWDESVARAVAFLVELSENKLSNQDYTDIMNAMLNMEAFSSMRLFAMAGEAARRCNSVLYNCSYIAIDSVRAFSEILYLSMSGTGVGFSVEKQFTQKLPDIRHQPETKIDSPVWIVDDSQEGWAEAFHIGLSSWFAGSDCVFDYSQVRPIGSVLKTKGGRASGYEPLKKLLDYSRETILNAQGRKLRPIEVHDIVCMIGYCAVSGGSRRSATISLFDRDDEEMLHAKDYGWWKTHPQRANANNSAVITRDLSYDEVEEIMYTMHNGGGGEPGFYMRKNAGKFAPRREFVTEPGTNPCVTGDTLVYVADGRGDVSIKALADEGADVPVFTLNNKGGMTIRMMRSPRKTGNSIAVYKVTLDSGDTIKATENHKFLKKDGNYVELKDISVGDSLFIATKYDASIKDIFKDANSNSQDYIWINYGQRKSRAEHRLIASFYHNDGGKIPTGFVVHHKDYNARNNAPHNLEIMSKNDHDTLHAKDMIGERNPMVRAKDEWSEEKWSNYKENMSKSVSGKRNGRYSGYSNEDLKRHAAILTKQLGRRASTNEWAEYAKSIGLPQQFSKWREAHLGGVSGFLKNAAASLGFDYIDEDPRLQQSYLTATSEGYDCDIINGELVFNKRCEYCGDQFQSRLKEAGVCSHSCSSLLLHENTKYSLKWRTALNDSHKNKKRQTRRQQIQVYSHLSWALGRAPSKTEWVQSCKEHGISAEISRRSSPFRYYKDLETASQYYNHKVISVEFCGYEDVYNGTVDEFHNFFVGGWRGETKNGKNKSVYLNNLQCGEIDLNSRQFCNLSQAIVRATDTPETLKEKVRVATIIGTIQSMATHFRYISDEWKQHTEKDRLLGVDLTGQLDHPELITPELLDELRKYAIEVNRQYADKLGITPSVAITCNKPSGNSSVLFSCAPGIHSQWSDYYIRRMRINANSPVRYALENSGFKLLPENGQEYSTATTLVAEFPMRAPDGAVTNGSRGAIEQCEWWKMNKIHWTEHNPSNTITYTADELDDLVWWVYDNQDIIGGMSFLEKDNHYYPLAPLEKINKETYERMVEELPDIDFNYLTELETEDYTTVASEVACIGGACLI